MSRLIVNRKIKEDSSIVIEIGVKGHYLFHLEGPREIVDRAFEAIVSEFSDDPKTTLFTGISTREAIKAISKLEKIASQIEGEPGRR